MDAPQGRYRRRQAKSSTLFRLVQQHWEEFEAVYEDRFEARYGPLAEGGPRIAEAIPRRCGR